MWIGIDDTDSPHGGCTTYALTEVIRAAREDGIDLVGTPRLVRLNPNVPWKTRGNAALSARFGRGQGPRRRVGSIDGRPVYCYRWARALRRAVSEAWLDRAWSVVRAASQEGEPGTDPALVASPRRLPSSLYWNAVRGLVRVDEVRPVLDRLRAQVRWSGTDCGVVGASASIAWPQAHPTWELLAYRSPGAGSRERRVDADSVLRAQRRWPSLFLCSDPRTRRLLVAPHTPCPILFGLRGRNPHDPIRALGIVRSEPVERWMLFVTNQGSGDHLAARRVREMAPFTSGRITGTVATAPIVARGGHVHFAMTDPDGARLSCVVFEPSKTLPVLAQGLTPGDRITVWGSRLADPTLRLEGITVRRLATQEGSRAGPNCSACHRRARSMGAKRGFRCPGCHRRWPPEAARSQEVPRRIVLGSYHPTPSARRHLAPLGPEP